MRYQFPSIKESLLNLKNKGCEEIFVVPLYPHYAMSTTLTTENEVKRINEDSNFRLDLTFIGAFYKEDQYIQSLCPFHR